MNRVMTILAGTVSVAALVLLVGCGADQSQTETTVEDAVAEAPATTEAPTAKAYPLDICIVSGEKLGSMGDPVVKTYAGREVKFCCAGCVEEFESNVPKYIAMVDSVAASDHDGHDHDGEDHTGHNH